MMPATELIEEPLTEADIEQFWRDGFLAGPQIYSGPELLELRAAIDRCIAGRSPARPELVRNLLDGDELQVIQIVNIWEADQSMKKHVYHPYICAIVARLMNSDQVRVWHDQVQLKPAGNGGPTRWHQDHPYWHVIQPADLITAWIPLVDATPENGCMWMVPGSHLWGPYREGTIEISSSGFEPDPDPALLPPGAKVRARPAPVRAGQLHLHHCLTWHGSPANSSPIERPAIAVHYMPGYTRYEPEGAHVMQHRISVRAGEVLQGAYFPLVWDRGPKRAP